MSYSGVVEWTSPTPVYTSFLEEGWKTTEDTSLAFSFLTPSTSYVFSVHVVMSCNCKSGEKVTITNSTGEPTGGKQLLVFINWANHAYITYLQRYLILHQCIWISVSLSSLQKKNNKLLFFWSVSGEEPRWGERSLNIHVHHLHMHSYDVHSWRGM